MASLSMRIAESVDPPLTNRALINGEGRSLVLSWPMKWMCLMGSLTLRYQLFSYRPTYSSWRSQLTAFPSALDHIRVQSIQFALNAELWIVRCKWRSAWKGFGNFLRFSPAGFPLLRQIANYSVPGHCRCVLRAAFQFRLGPKPINRELLKLWKREVGVLDWWELAAIWIDFQLTGVVSLLKWVGGWQ